MRERIQKYNDRITKSIRSRGLEVQGPQDAIDTHEMFAQHIETYSERISEHMVFSQESVILGEDGSFTNRYRILCSRGIKDIEPAIKPKALPLKRHLINNMGLKKQTGGFNAHL